MGYLTGFCEGSFGPTIRGGNRDGRTEHEVHYHSSSNCKCTNDLKDAYCGPDGSYAGIRCPFDLSACKRKCCREGTSGGYCGGFLGTKCTCDSKKHLMYSLL